MLPVTNLNLFTQPFKNIRELLITNTDGVPVTNSFSKNSNIPVIILKTRPVQFQRRRNSLGINNIIVDIQACHTTRLKADTLAGELKNLIDASTDFDANLMELLEFTSTSTTVELSAKTRMHIKTLTVIFNIG